LAIFFCAFAFEYAGIMPIAKILKINSVAIRLMLHAEQNDERPAERAED